MTEDEKWYREGPPVIEALAERIWSWQSFPDKLPWVELGVQGRVGPRRRAYEIFVIVAEHQERLPFGDPRREPGNFQSVPVPAGQLVPGVGIRFQDIRIGPDPVDAWVVADE